MNNGERHSEIVRYWWSKAEESIEEKLQAMELLWDDLCWNAADFVTPEWHKDVLGQREERLRNGEERLLDWEQAKKEIEESLP